MIESLEELLTDHRPAAYAWFHRLLSRGRELLLWSDVVETCQEVCRTEAGRVLAEPRYQELVEAIREVVVHPPLVHLALRPGVATWQHALVHAEEMSCREISVSEYLQASERVVSRGDSSPWTLEIDLRPFERGFPKLKEVRSIGRGVEYLNRHLSGRLFVRGEDGHRRLLEFLRMHQVEGQQLMLNGLVGGVGELRKALRRGLQYLERAPEGTPWEDLSVELRQLGFAPGWGRTAGRIAESMQLLVEILEAPAADLLERFLARIPMVFSIVAVTPHGYFGQSGVLGKPDTGGQVVYILDQVKALEREMRRSIREQGLEVEPRIVVLTRLIPEAGETTCDQRLEPILGTESAHILRIPFRDEHDEIVPHWVSRFHLWRYLERFAAEAETEVLAHLGGRPDLVIGNYSDGNLVASILSDRLGVIQCNIAHALEKTKYLHSDLYWRDHEEAHRFSCQYTADLIAMNTADFILTSTFQEIAGTDQDVGQYESYRSFTLPGLYRVIAGVDCFDPKFNVVAPGADPEVFFPFSERERRPEALTAEVERLVFGPPGKRTRGSLADRERPLLMAMSRLDVIKNMAGLLEWYAGSPALQEEANLLLVGGRLDPAESTDGEERSQVERLHQLLESNSLDKRVRWVEMQADKNRVGEIYRVVADSRGAFVLPALFEAFGLTVVEAMSSGLPVFATRFGGPLESIEDGVSGFHLDPNHGNEAAEAMAGFFSRCRQHPEGWERISHGAVARVEERYTWRRYAQRLLTYSRIYGFWKYISNIEREETRRYLEMVYGLIFRPLALGRRPGLGS